MSDNACDLCNESIRKPDGHVFYSKLQINGQTVGNMLLCDRCTSGVLQCLEEGQFADSNPLSRIMTRSDDDDNLQQTIKMARVSNVAEITTLCRERGLTPTTARTKARELAVKYWDDPSAGRIAALIFWDPEAVRRFAKALSPSGPSWLLRVLLLVAAVAVIWYFFFR